MQDFTPPPCSPRRQRNADAAPNDVSSAVSKATALQAREQPPVGSVSEYVEKEHCASPLCVTPAPSRMLLRGCGDSLDVPWCEQDRGAQDDYPCKNTFVHFQDPPVTRARSPRTEPRSFKPEAWDRWPSTPGGPFAVATPWTGVPAMKVLPLVLAGVEGSPCVIGRVVPKVGGTESAVPAMMALDGFPEPASRASDPTTLRLADLLFA